MRLALLSDIHGNLDALEACLDQIGEVGVDGIVILGDLVGYGPDPERVIDVVADLNAKGAIVIKGNHDEAIERGTAATRQYAKRQLTWLRSEPEWIWIDPAEPNAAGAVLNLRESPRT